MSDVESHNHFEQPDWPLEPCTGDTHLDSQGRLWTCYAIHYGAHGGRWAYRAFWPKTVVVYTHQHFHANHFAGMLSMPWDGFSKLGWVLGKQWCSPVAEKLVQEPVDGVRFERLQEPPND